MIEGVKIPLCSYLKYLHVLPGIHKPGKDLTSKDPITTIYLDYWSSELILSSIIPLIMPRRKLQGRYLFQHNQRKNQKYKLITVFLIHMYNLFSLEKKNHFQVLQLCDVLVPRRF